MSNTGQEHSPESDIIFSAEDAHWMNYALQLAEKGEAMGEVPVGAVIVQDGNIIGEGFNQPISSHDPTAHAEIIALRQAAMQVQNYRLVGSTIYVTLEPCTMCVGALIHARLARLVFGTTEPKAGAVISKSRLLDNNYFNHRIDYAGGVLSDRCQHQLSQFFARRRQEKRNQKFISSPE
ncbi:tRNA adenosine(34) deaminase TadA [Cellvibrio sp. UBA7671]|uniref:tRNA adenosine(34) deaminase TadA n=1 Tax=Cellvibrio sp. UBA7671 TaxID=1946312 RepID=UPI002F35BABA